MEYENKFPDLRRCELQEGNIYGVVAENREAAREAASTIEFSKPIYVSSIF